MSSPASRLPRMLRTALVVAVVLSTSTLAHLSAGGSAATTGALLGLAVVSVPVVYLLTARRLSGPALGALVLGGQAFFHAAHSYLGGLDAHAGHVHHGPSSTMVGAHILAGLVTAVLLTRAERLLWLVWAWMSPRAARVAGPIRPVSPRPEPPTPWATSPSFVTLFLAHAVARRGPPSLV